MIQTAGDVRKSDKWIPYYFVLFFLVVGAVNAVFIYKALHSFSGVVTDNAYEHGLAYNKTLDRAEAEQSLHITEDIGFKGGELRWTLHDKAGKPLDKAIVRAKFIRAVQEGKDFERTMAYKGNGVYSVPVEAPLGGAWTAKLEATWDKQQLQTTYRFVIPE